TRKEHRAILEALRRRDPEGAKRAVEAHVFRFRDLVVGRLRKGGG
ncbi:FCD domain-containing protein, partial [Acinetobacter baumannii]